MRDRLIELLKNQNCPSSYLCDEKCKYAHLENCYLDRTADWLLENGVVVIDTNVVSSENRPLIQTVFDIPLDKVIEIIKASGKLK